MSVSRFVCWSVDLSVLLFHGPWKPHETETCFEFRSYYHQRDLFCFVHVCVCVLCSFVRSSVRWGSFCVCGCQGRHFGSMPSHSRQPTLFRAQGGANYQSILNKMGNQGRVADATPVCTKPPRTPPPPPSLAVSQPPSAVCLLLPPPPAATCPPLTAAAARRRSLAHPPPQPFPFGGFFCEKAFRLSGEAGAEISRETSY